MYLINYSSVSIRREQQLPEQPLHLKEEASVREAQVQDERRKKEVIIDA
jgi:hypothetical protein